MSKPSFQIPNIDISLEKGKGALFAAIAIAVNKLYLRKRFKLRVDLTSLPQTRNEQPDIDQEAILPQDLAFIANSTTGVVQAVNQQTRNVSKIRCCKCDKIGHIKRFCTKIGNQDNR